MRRCGGGRGVTRSRILSALNALSKNKFGLIRSLHYKKSRQGTGLTLLEGERLIAEALQAGIRMETVVGSADFWSGRPDLIHRCAAAGVATWVATPKQLEALSTTEHPAGSLAVVVRPQWTEESLWRRAEQRPLLGVLAVTLQDPGNLGTIVRTLAAGAGSGAWLSAGCAEASSPKLLRASAGAVLRLPVVEQAAPAAVLEACRRQGVQTLAAAPRGGRTHTTFDLTRPALFVLGGEGGGLTPELIQACDHAVQIPMPGGVESLNVSVAGAILIYEAVRQRRLAQAAKRGNEGERALERHS